jgi:hypothetical protein
LKDDDRHPWRIEREGQPRAGVRPGAPELAGGFRRIDEQVATIVFATLAVSKWIEDRTG